MKNKKKLKIKFAPQDKINDLSYQLIENLFGITGIFLSNESILEDFEPDMRRRQLLARVESLYRISLKDYPKDEPLYVWKIVHFIKLMSTL